VINAYTIDILEKQELGLGNMLTTQGWRFGMIISGGLALSIGQHYGWQICYMSMAVLMLICTVITYFSPEPQKLLSSSYTIQEAVISPFIDLFQRRHFWALIFVLIFYKLGDNLAVSLLTHFFKKGVGFSGDELFFMYKIVGLSSTIAGSILGSILLMRFRIYQGLFYFGILQALSILMYMWLAYAGKVHWLLAGSVFVESFCSNGLGALAFSAFMMNLCHTKYSASQYAFLTAVMALPRTLISWPAGYLATSLGWPHFFLWSFIICLPGLWIVWWLDKHGD
jgi:PAT family beta-lactamase induction signal transducer AmpG